MGLGTKPNQNGMVLLSSLGTYTVIFFLECVVKAFCNFVGVSYLSQEVREEVGVQVLTSRPRQSVNHELPST